MRNRKHVLILVLSTGMALYSASASAYPGKALVQWCKNALAQLWKAQPNAVPPQTKPPEIPEVKAPEVPHSKTIEVPEGLRPNEIPEPRHYAPKWPSKNDYERDPNLSEQRRATLEVLKLIAEHMSSRETDNQTRLRNAERILEYVENLEARFPNATKEYIDRYSVATYPGSPGTRLHFLWQENPEVMANAATRWAIQHGKKMKTTVSVLQADAMKMEFGDTVNENNFAAKPGTIPEDALDYDFSAIFVNLGVRALDPDATEREKFPPGFRGQ